ncbi:very short patch repair endonuclease [Pseudomonas aeruginosa]|uniref:very short patch repair endonuclease n=1 Tax=Pseudomonas aeruginosa TaxID=287 RepID=UPI003FD50D9D
MTSPNKPRNGAQKPTYMDVTPETRSRMQAVRRRDTGPELLVRRALHGMGFRFRLQRKDLPGTPDIVLPRHRIIVLVHGCFWHGHEGCNRAKIPVNNACTWHEKIRLNKERDKRIAAALHELGWNVLIIWECEARNSALLERLLKSFIFER